MKKFISKEQIVDTVLDMLRHQQDFKNINMREIARTLGCAHTNLYNYFSSYTDLLWAAHTALQGAFMKILREQLSSVVISQMNFGCFFEAYLNTYLMNIGWFRLAWLEYIGDERPQSDMIATQIARDELNHYILAIWKEKSDVALENDSINSVLHHIQCYIIGEVSIYISGRNLVNDETEFQAHVVKQAIKMITLSLREECQI